MAAEAPRRNPGTIVLALVLALLGAWVWHAARGMSVMASVFPFTIAAVLIASSLGSLVLELARPAPPEATGGSWPRRLLLIAVLLAWALLLPVLGFAVTSLAAFLLVALIGNHDPWTPARAAAVALAALVGIGGAWLLLTRVLQVPMPQALLF